MRAIILFTLILACLGPGSGPSLDAADGPTAAILRDPTLPVDPGFAAEIAQQVQAAGYAVRFLEADALTNAATLSRQEFPLLVLTEARTLPLEAAESIRAYLRRGGSLIALGAPLWHTPVSRIQGRWLTAAAYEAALLAVTARVPLVEFTPASLKSWTRNSNDRQGNFQCEAEAVEIAPSLFPPAAEPRPAPGVNPVAVSSKTLALHVTVKTDADWETLAAQRFPQAFPAGHSLTCFRAKGGANTRLLMLEWEETDGSRWIATVALTPEWKEYVLPPTAFKAWTPPPGRGRTGDFLHVAQARRFTVGLATSHGSNMRAANEYWLANLSTAPHPFGEALAPSSASLPHLEPLTPGYLFYPVTTPARLLIAPFGLAPGETAVRSSLASTTVESAMVSPTEPLYALHPRPSGTGYAQNRPGRWQPILEAVSDVGEYRGAVGALLANANSGTIAVLTPNEPAFYRQPSIKQLLRDTAARIRKGVFLIEGGAECFTLFTNQTVRLGARVANQGNDPQPGLTLRLQVVTKESAQPALAVSVKLPVDGGSTRTFETNWLPTLWPASGYRVIVELTDGATTLDRLEHELQVWQPKGRPHFMRTEAGGFSLEGQPWKAHGVNYMPSSGVAQPNEWFEYWLGRGAYDPVIIERDLRRIKAMNLNAVSAFIYHRSLGGQHLLDFLRRCDALGLRVNLSLRPGTPLDFRWAEMKALIEYYRLAQNDTVIAYDLAWEPSHFDQSYQEAHYGKAWEEWVLKRHGRLDMAQGAWGFPAAPVSLGTLRIPSLAQLTQDGPWRKMVADYRLFLDQMLSTSYAEARRLVRSIDPNHPISFRMQLAGDPTHNTVPVPYDFRGLANAVDIWEPEAYGRIGDWERVKPGLFTVAYARLCDPAKPVVWAEMGNSVWDMSSMAPSPARLEFTAGYYRDFYRMMIAAGCDGVFFWWYAGGFRLNEQSDYGILNADGTDREISRVIRTEGARFLAAPKPPKPNHWIAVDRDRDARGLVGIYQAAQAEFWQAVEAGEVPGLIWLEKVGR